MQRKSAVDVAVAVCPCWLLQDRFTAVFGSNFSVTPEQYAADFLTFRQLLSAYSPSSAPLLAITPDDDFVPLFGDFLFTETFLAALQKLGPQAQPDVVTWHFYPTFATEHFNKKVQALVRELTVRGVLTACVVEPSLSLVATHLQALTDAGSLCAEPSWGVGSVHFQFHRAVRTEGGSMAGRDRERCGRRTRERLQRLRGRL